MKKAIKKTRVWGIRNRKPDEDIAAEYTKDGWLKALTVESDTGGMDIMSVSQGGPAIFFNKMTAKSYLFEEGDKVQVYGTITLERTAK